MMASASVYTKVGKQGRSYLDTWETSAAESLVDVLQGLYVSEGGFPREDNI